MAEEILIPLLAFIAVVCLGGAVVATLIARRQPLKARLLGMQEESEGGAGPSARWVANLGKLVSGKGPTRTLREELAQAGYHDPAAAAIFLGAKVLSFLTGVAAGVPLFLPLKLSAAHSFLLIFSGGAALSLVPNIVVKLRRARRRREIETHLPDAIDLLEICVSSGMGLDMAWNSVAADVRRVSPILADEMALANLEMHLGAERAVALRHMAERTGADEVAALVATLVQSEKFGTSIVDALKIFASSMRMERTQKAEEAAEKMSVKLIFPMVLFLFPAMLIVMIGPACLIIVRTLGIGQ